MSPEEQINIIQKDHLSSSERTLRTLKGAIETIKITFPHYGSFLMEFIQNADDEKSRFIKFEIKEKILTISNDGNIFTAIVYVFHVGPGSHMDKIIILRLVNGVLYG